MKQSQGSTIRTQGYKLKQQPCFKDSKLNAVSVMLLFVSCCVVSSINVEIRTRVFIVTGWSPQDYLLLGLFHCWCHVVVSSGIIVKIMTLVFIVTGWRSLRGCSLLQCGLHKTTIRVCDCWININVLST